jgi:hypothetical protein
MSTFLCVTNLANESLHTVPSEIKKEYILVFLIYLHKFLFSIDSV